MELLIRPRPLYFECLSSYKQRIAAANFVDSHELWRFMLPKGAHYPQSSISSTIDIYPYSLLDVVRLESMLLLSPGSLDSLTFIPVNQKLGISNENIQNSRVLSGLIEIHRKFCPQCLYEKNYYKLIWQVKEISHCEIHGIELKTRCPRCERLIPIIPISSQIGFCPYCYSNLAECRSNKYSGSISRVYEDWFYLLNTPNIHFVPIENLTNEQALAFRLLFISSTLLPTSFSDTEQVKYKALMQIARNSKVSQTFIHLSTILSLSRKAEIPIESLLTATVPSDYVNSILKMKQRLSSVYACIAPWCSSYLMPGSLKRTSTSKKTLKDGSTYNYYMYCEKCGIEYRLINRELKERMDFISFAWNTVKDYVKEGISSISDLSRNTGRSEDKVKRAIIYLLSNKLISTDKIPFGIPKSHMPEIMNKMKFYIKTGFTAKGIQKELQLKYYDFLFYWFHPEISKEYINRKVPKKKKSNNKSVCFEQAIDFLIKERIPITISKVSKYLNVCPETLRNWGCLNRLKEVKKEQSILFLSQKRQEYINKAEEFAALSVNEKRSFLSEDLYCSLGIRRNVMVRNFPDVTHYISKLIKKAASEILQTD